MPKTGNAPHLIRIHPTPTELRRVLREFGTEPGYVTALGDDLLWPLKQLGFNEESLELLAFGELLGRIGVDANVPSRALPASGQLSAVAKLVCEDLGEDSIFAQVAGFAGFHTAIVSTLRELRYAGLNADRLEEIADKTSPDLAPKLRQLAGIDRSIESSLEAIGKSGAWRRVDQILDCQFERELHFKRLLVFAGKTFRPTVMKLLRKLAEHGIDVHVVVEVSPNAFEIAELVNHAIEPSGIRYPRDPHWTEQLFGEGVASSGPNAIIFSAADVLAECEWALRLCRDATDRGIFDHKIAIVIPNTDTYAPILKSVGERFGIVVDVRLVVPLLTNGFANIMKKTLEALVSEDIRAILKLCQSSYFPTKFQQRKALKDHLDVAILTETSSWNTVWTYARDHEDELPWLAEVMQWRNLVADERLTVAEWTVRFYELTIIDALSETTSDADGKKVHNDQRSQMALLRAIQEYAPAFDYRKAHPIGFKEFVEIAINLWDRECTVLPSSGKGVRVIREPWEATDCDVLIALGLLEGSMPRRRAEEPILSDSERHEINSHLDHKDRLMDSHFEARAERDAFIRICGAPAVQLILGYPETGEDRDNVAASYLEEVKRTLGDKVDSREYPRKELFGLLASGKMVEADLNLLEAMEGPRVKTVIELIQLDEAKEKIRPNFEDGISVGEILTGMSCPFQSVARHRLHLKRNAFRFESKLAALPKRAQLAKISTEQEATRTLNAQLNQLLREAAYQTDEWELALAEASGRRMIEGWVDLEFSARRQWGITNIRADVDLSDPVFQSTMKVAGRTVKITGTVAAVSEIGPYTAVRLYKTGVSANFPKVDKSPEKWLEYVIYGCLLRNTNSAVEVDHGGAARALNILKRREGDGITGKGNFLKIHRIDIDDWIATLDQARELMAQSVIQLASGEMKAIPNEDSCKHCDYGDLCRVSTELADLAAEQMEVPNVKNDI